MEQLLSEFPEQRRAITTLAQYIGPPGSRCPPLFVYGPSSTGKSSIVRGVLEASGEPYAFVDCIQCPTARMIFESAINAWTGHVPGPDNDYENHSRCDRLNDFLAAVGELASSQRIFLVLDHAERVRSFSPAILPALLRLDEMTGRVVSCILISEVVWEFFRPETMHTDPVLIHFPEFTKDGMMRMLTRGCPVEEERPLYQAFCQLLVDILYDATRDFSELRYLCELLYPRYVQPVRDGSLPASDQRRLYKAFEPTLRAVLDKLYLREMSGVDWSAGLALPPATRAAPAEAAGAQTADGGAAGSSAEAATAGSDAAATAAGSGMAPPGTPLRSHTAAALPASPATPRAGPGPLMSVLPTTPVAPLGSLPVAPSHQATRLELELPYRTKYLLLAAYLASYNPARLDAKFFSGQPTRSRAGLAAAEKRAYPQRVLGPRPFVLTRMLAIFLNLTDGPEVLTADVYTQVASLVSLGLLSSVSAPGTLDEPRFRCNLSTEAAQSIAQHLGFPLHKYLAE